MTIDNHVLRQIIDWCLIPQHMNGTDVGYYQAVADLCQAILDAQEGSVHTGTNSVTYTVSSRLQEKK